MNKLLLALLAMFLVLGLAYAQAEPTPCPKGDECAAWETCSGGETPVCEPTKCTAEQADVCKGGFCRVEGETGACEEKITACPPWQKLNEKDNSCDNVDCTADGNECTTAPVVGFCDVTTKKCVEKTECETWKKYDVTDNTCADIDCESSTDEVCGDEGFCQKKAEPAANDPYGVCISNECTANADCGADGFCKKAADAKEGDKGVCEALCIQDNCAGAWESCNATTNTCQQDACSDTTKCKEGAFCDKTTKPDAPVCVALCVPDDCVKGSKCNTETNQCEAIACKADQDPSPCGEGAECDGDKCVPVQVKVKLQRVGAVLSRSRADGEDAKYDALTLAFKTALDASTICEPLNAKPVAFAKRSIGYYVKSTCTDTEVKEIAAAINGSDDEEEKSEAEEFVALDDSKPVTAELELTTVSEAIPDTCIEPEFKCGTTECNYPCQEGTACTKDDEDLVCGDHQKCVIENDKGTCNSAAIYSTLVAIVLAVAAIVF